MIASAGDAARLASVGLGTLVDALQRDGLWLDIGAATVRIQSDSHVLDAQMQRAYGEFPFCPSGEWADLHLQIMRASGLRRWLRPQVSLRCDGQNPFEPFPADSPLPLLEWGCNWLIGSRLNDLLLLHAGAVERDGLALLLPALPGSGKSTLTAALSQRGWRLLSDEFGVFDPQLGAFRAMLKPIALKNQSIDVIRRFAPEAVFGPEFPKTRKGTVAHVAAGIQAVEQRKQIARPGAVLLPKWSAGSLLRLEPVSAHMLFSALAFNAFNYRVLGAVGFESVVALVRQCPAWQLVYSDLDEAVAVIETIWPQVQDRQGRTITFNLF